MEEGVNMEQFLSEYFSYDERRKAVIKDQFGYFVELWENGRLVESRDLSNHTKQYAQDCAENWCEGTIK